MPKPRKQTRAATRSRPKAGSGRVLRAALGILAAMLGWLVASLTPLKGWAAIGLAALWRSRNSRRLAGLCAGAALSAALAWVMLGNLRAENRFQLDPGRIELSATPSWARPELGQRVKAEIETDLRAELAQLPATDAFDASLPETLALALQASPWVQQVVRIERRFPEGPEGASRLHPVLEIRQPALLVATSDRTVVVDGQGYVLPLTLSNLESDLAAFQAQVLVPLHLVKGVTTAAPKAGKIWVSEQVSAALSMELILRKSELDRSLPIDAIELIGVPEHPDARGRVYYPSDGCVMLWPDQKRYPGARLIWGRPPVHASTLEASPNEKLAELKRRMDQPPEALVGARVDLRRRTS